MDEASFDSREWLTPDKEMPKDGQGCLIHVKPAYSEQIVYAIFRSYFGQWVIEKNNNTIALFSPHTILAWIPVLEWEPSQIRCTCVCHTLLPGSVKHIKPCCNNGYKKLNHE